ncbi:MAG: hypothetical protein L0207_02700 [Chlamydiae bacterium]|nr:hypothetical protein [Chlamydiota bacterium]
MKASLITLIKDTISYLESSYEFNETILISQQQKGFFGSSFIRRKIVHRENEPTQQKKIPYFAPKKVEIKNRLLSKPALLKKNNDFSANLKAAFEQQCVEHMGEKADFRDAKKQIFSEEMGFRKKSNEEIPLKIQPVLKIANPQKGMPPSEIKMILSKLFPNLAQKDHYPSDQVAKERAEAWKKRKSEYAVAILFSSQTSREFSFLKKLSLAIHTKLAAAKMIDVEKLTKEKKWDRFLGYKWKLIICTENLVAKSSDLSQFISNNEEQKLLGKFPLILLSIPIEKYQNEYETKQTLWNELCQILQPAQKK